MNQGHHIRSRSDWPDWSHRPDGGSLDRTRSTKGTGEAQPSPFQPLWQSERTLVRQRMNVHSFSCEGFLRTNLVGVRPAGREGAYEAMTRKNPGFLNLKSF